MRPQPCCICGTEFTGRGKTCSRRCRGLLASQQYASETEIPWPRLEPERLRGEFWRHNIAPGDGYLIRQPGHEPNRTLGGNVW